MRQYDNTGDGSMSLQERETGQGTVLRQDRGRKAFYLEVISNIE